MKKILIYILIILAALFLYQNKTQLQSLVKQYSGVSLASLTPSSDLLEKIGQSTELLPEPLQNSVKPQSNFILTKGGVITETNLQRKANGEAPLKENTLLDKDATLKLQDLFEKQYFEHVSPTGVAPADLADKVGYKYILVGENLALGNFKNDKELVEAWMNSPGHRENILNKKYLEIGVAVGKGIYQGQETWIAVQSFGTPLSSCPSVNTDEKQQIDSNRSLINQMSAELAQKKAQIESATYQNRDDYNESVSIYNSLVEKFNTLVEQTKALVEDYNNQVNIVNQCIKQ